MFFFVFVQEFPKRNTIACLGASHDFSSLRRNHQFRVCLANDEFRQYLVGLPQKYKRLKARRQVHSSKRGATVTISSHAQDERAKVIH